MPTEIHEGGADATLEPGHTHYWEYSWDGADAGVCYATVSTASMWLGHLEVVQQGMTGGLGWDGFVVNWHKRTWTYTVAVRNDGQGPVAYHLRIARLLP